MREGAPEASRQAYRVPRATTGAITGAVVLLAQRAVVDLPMAVMAARKRPPVAKKT